MTTIVDPDTGQVLGIVDGCDSEGVGDWLFARPLPERLGVQVVAIDTSAAFRKALRMWLPRTAVSVDAFHLVKLGNDMLAEVRQCLTQQVHGRGGGSIDPVWANRRLLFRAGDTLSEPGRDRLSTVFATDDATGKLQVAWLVKEQLRALLATGSLADAAAAKDRLQILVQRAAQPETNRLWRTVCRWWKEIEVLIVTGATTAKVVAINTAIEHIKRPGRGFSNARNYTTRILVRSVTDLRTGTAWLVTICLTEDSGSKLRESSRLLSAAPWRNLPRRVQPDIRRSSRRRRFVPAQSLG